MYGEGIRNARKAAKITQEELAKQVGINRATLSKYESGVIEPSISQLQKIAECLGLNSWADIVGEQLVNQKMTELLFHLGPGEKPTEKMWSILAIDAALDLLNESGQQKAVERVEELTEIPKYQKEKTPSQETQDGTGDK